MKQLAITLLLLLAGPLVQAPAQGFHTERIAFGLQNPGFLAQAPGDNERLFVFERRKGIRIIKDGAQNTGLYLDLTAELSTNEAGTCFAFHPDYQNNGRMYVLYMDAQEFTHLAEYTVSATDPDVVEPTSRIQILGPFPQPFIIHNWDCIKFGPDGMLYLSTGDGEQTTTDNVNNSQDLSSPLGKILRIDIDLPAPYVPADNPFVGQPGVDESVWMYGLRQPWRFSFDPLTDDLYIADVGLNSWEEINILNAGTAAGKNMGWRCYEGNACTNYVGTGVGCNACGSPTYTPPVLAYSHAEGRCAIIGGDVYRGSKIPELYGTYFYGDFCAGRFWSFKWDGSQVTSHVERTGDLIPDIGPDIDFPTSFGVDNEGEIYILSNAGGEVYKIVPDLECTTSNYCTATANSIGRIGAISSSGSTSVSANDFVLTVTGVLPNKFGLYFYGAIQVQVPFGEGFRCVGGGIWRLNPAIVADGAGNNQRPVDIQNPPQAGAQITVGSTWNFQYWYRDSMANGLFNLSDGLEAQFCP
ncbi:MAG: glucose/arabinose dehydrogenase [Planctomycetota bacterium]|jgi:glucose/arabinose dehydrogenase